MVLGVVLGHQHVDLVAHHLRCGVAEQLLCCNIELDDHTSGVNA